MAKLRGNDVILWKLDQQREKGVPLRAPHLFGVSKYRCSGCEKVFYYKTGDSESPQYAKGYPLKSKRHNPYCHKCWHRYNLRGAVRSPECWLCELRNARQARQAGLLRSTPRIEETGEIDRANDFGIEPTTAPWKQVGVRRSVGLSKGRRGSKDKKNRSTRRR